MGFVAPVVSAVAGGLGAAGSAIGGALASGAGALASGMGALGGAGSAIASAAGPMLSSILGGGGSGIGAIGGGGRTSGLGQLGQFLGDLIPTAAAFGVGESGELDISNINVMTPEQANLLKALSQKTLEAIERPDAGPSRLQQMAFGAAPSIASALGQPLGDVFDASIASPARTAFMEELAPRLRAAYGAQGAGSSSALNRQLAKQASQLETNLAAQRAGFMESARSSRLADILNVATLGAQQRDIGRFPSPALAALLGQPLQATQFQPIAQMPAPQPGAGALISQAGRGGGLAGLGNILGGFGDFLGGLF